MPKLFQNKTNELWATMPNTTIAMEVEVHTFGEAQKKCMTHLDNMLMPTHEIN